MCVRKLGIWAKLKCKLENGEEESVRDEKQR
ncbi:unnamed protein product [Arabidopsis thaliana]|uniref:Uncharacterized protein n=4 Tax=Arabidopsis TaxID=3701 RepID=A0A654EBX4_ARATH|nr:uncharacterized protein AT1G21738 [Arabidopsis thaliana]KAG7647138.1 hypothetical protein ISN45_At01g022020 [Arabidopsis thaliana x Arabidopsis arenosa]KAG7655113.1 hypothetical protein ISN44_As01g022140 [Arabidopsis suecica]AEE30149.1 hypothetical protein AT1G21738 [Arabidopsis thaliana]CAA0230028.1 unnamed protein product [Arabidopsis thaliana]VYS46819.1 unnamed protein product [Arabidopsis thaliana]|eukprot:NP_001319059.1 hypothetical protein AT1G21738 [Arabidopsis thaliana]